LTGRTGDQEAEDQEMAYNNLVTRAKVAPLEKEKTMPIATLKAGMKKQGKIKK